MQPCAKFKKAMDTFVGQVRDLGKEYILVGKLCGGTNSPHFLDRIPNFPSLVSRQNFSRALDSPKNRLQGARGNLVPGDDYNFREMEFPFLQKFPFHR